MGQNEDCSPGDSISDSPEKFLQSGREKISKYVILVKGEFMQSSAYFLQKVTTSLVKVSASNEAPLSP